MVTVMSFEVRNFVTTLSRNFVTEMSFYSKNWVRLLLAVELLFINLVTVTSFEAVARLCW